MSYAELHCLSNFSFLRGASHPEELVARAARLGYAALAVTDECSMAGIVRAHQAAKEHGIRLIVGSEFRCEEGLKLVALAPDRQAYGALCALISHGRQQVKKGAYRLTRMELARGLPGCLVIWLPDGLGTQVDARWVAEQFPGRAWLGVELLAAGDDKARLQALRRLGESAGLPLVACSDVHMHVRGRRALQDTLTAVRLRSTVAAAGRQLFANGERHLRSLARLRRIYPSELLAGSLDIAARCTFSLDALRYEYPHELVPAGITPAAHLRALTEAGIRTRWPQGAPGHVRELVEHELALIAELGYEHYFLTVHDIVHFARGRDILCQGRGSAANSAVCFCLGITEVDPSRMRLLFERFVSRERDEPPDIDVDFEHERREEVIQYLYRKYGRERAALAATVISYRPRSAVRDVGRALGLDEARIRRLAGAFQWWDGSRVDDARLREAGMDPASPVVQRLIALVKMLIGFPRHLSQHVGGFVISRGPLCELVPIEAAAMPERTVIEWDKDDLDALGLLKVDVLALGMLSAIRRSFQLIERHGGPALTLAGVPAGDGETYAMIQRADTMGVFQIESRAQMAMLPRLRPENYYDLVIEVAIIRPGPIQGDMVHPYLARRAGEEPVTYPSAAVREVLERTLGVPIFQEQVMQIAMVAAGFTPGEADRLRRAMAAWKRKGGLGPFEDKLIRGMRARGYTADFAERIFRQIKGFGEYGFPESHAASFALLVYVSAWLKCHHPAAFTCALLNSQPMGFYAPSQLVQDAHRHGVEVLPVRVEESVWECTLERGGDGNLALRLGLCMVSGLGREMGERIVEARVAGEYADVDDLARRAELDRPALEHLVAADALRRLSGNRHRSRWAVAGVETPLPLLAAVPIPEGVPMLRVPAEGEEIVADFRSLGLSLGRHPLALLRARLDRLRVLDNAQLAGARDGQSVAVAGMVINRQRPGSAAGVTFMTLEDEHGHANIIVWRQLAEKQRRALLSARLLLVRGVVQRQDGVLHVIAGRLEDHSHLLGRLYHRSRDFR